MIFPIIFRHAAFGEHAPGLGNPLVMNGIAITAHQVMPQRQVLAFADQAIAAGRRQPFEFVGLARRELDTVRHSVATVRIIRALAGFQVQQFAGDARVIDAVVVFVFKLLQAAQSTAVAQRLPFLLIELIEGLAYPERFYFGGHGSSIDIRW
ncbi:hypothetical protein D3C87_1144560 [compost metagenome]